MKKRLFSMIFSLVIIMVLALSAGAKTILVHDFANILTSEDEIQLTDMAQTIQDSHGIDVIILTTPELYGIAGQEFADHFYENNSYGEDVVLFLVDMGSRQWHISTAGTAIDLLSDRDLMAIEDQVVPYLSDGRYYDAFHQFMTLLPKYLVSDAGSGMNFLLSLLAGAAIAGIAVLIMRSTMNSGKPQRSAAGYTVDNSYHLRQHLDLFLYSNISKRPRPKNNSSGSSVHRSSSGGSHGGRGGRF